MANHLFLLEFNRHWLTVMQILQELRVSDTVIKYLFLDYQYKETGFSNIMSAATKAMTDDELLTMVQKACFQILLGRCRKYKWHWRKKIFPGRTDMIAAGASGFGIMALIVGTERKFITRQQSVETILKNYFFS